MSTLNSHVDLVRPDPSEPTDQRPVLYPTGQRGYARVLPSDDYEAAAGALYAQQISPRGVFYVQDLDDVQWATYFRIAAQRIGLRILGTGHPGAGPRGDRRLAQRIRASGAGAVYINFVDAATATHLGRLRAGLGPHVAIISSSRLYPITSLFEHAGAAARGIYITVSGPPVDRLGPAGRRFLHDFGATRPGGHVPAYSLYAAAATTVLLDAIARSDGTRGSVSRALATVRLPDSPLGPIALDPHGEPTRNPVAVVRADHGGEPFDPAGASGGVVVRVITPPARLVGG